jgi:F-type H+-transporting ATPase subunit epsilon
MADRAFTVDIVTPDRVVLSTPAVSLIAPGVQGAFGILANHSPLLSELEPGELRFRTEGGEETRLVVGGGFLQVFENQVTVLADTAHHLTEIDVVQARAAREEARARLARAQSAMNDDEAAEAELDLARAVALIRAAEA